MRKRYWIGAVIGAIVIASLLVVMLPVKPSVSGEGLLSISIAQAQEPQVGDTIRTATSRVTYLGNNRYAYYGSVGVINYKDKLGDWHDIDRDYSEADIESFSAKFTKLPYLIRIGDDSTRRIYPNRNDLSYWIELGKPFASMGAPTKTGGYWVWDFTNAIIAVKLSNRGVTLGFRLKNSNAPTSITMPFNSQGIQRNGRYILHNGYIVGTLTKPVATDANGVERDCTVSWGAGSVTFSLNTTGLAFPIDVSSAFALGGSPPVVESVNGGNDTVNGTSHTVNLPSGIEAGDLILVFFASDGNPTITFPSGWTANIFDIPNGSACKFTCHYRVADGTEGSTITVTTSASEMTSHTTYRISGSIGFPTEATATGTTANPDPPNKPTGGAQDYLWLAACGYDYNRTVSAYPTNYTDGRNDYANNTGGCGIGTARRALNAASEDPSTFTISASDQWIAATVAIAPCGEIDPTFSVGASSDDAYQSGSTVTLTGTYLGSLGGTIYRAGMRFTGVNIPSGATIGVAYNQVYVYSVSYDDPICFPRFQDANNPSTFTTANNDISDRPQTSVSATWDEDDIGEGLKNTPSQVAALQEVVDGNGGTGDAVASLWQGWTAGNIRFASWDNTTYDPPALYLEWTAAGGEPDISGSPTTWTLNGITGNSRIDPNTTYYANPLGDTTAPSTTVTDSECYFTVTNSSTMNINLVVNCSNFSGGSANMTNSNLGSNGATSYGGYSWYSGMTYANKKIMKTTGSDVLWTSSSPGDDIKLGAEIKTQTNEWTGGTSSTATLTITASAS